jgi:hypothetical protein
MLIAGLSVAGGAVAAGSPTDRTVHVAIPAGWKSNSYGHATISVPKSWVVEHNTNCSRPNSLLLGFPNPLEFCPNERAPSSVAIFHPVDQPAPTGAFTKVNGLPVYVTMGSPFMLEWIAPTLGLEITGMGPGASRIMHTLRHS